MVASHSFWHNFTEGLRMSSREPRARLRHGAVGFGQRLYVWGGYGRSRDLNAATVESFDLSSELWEQQRQLCASLPGKLWGTAVATDGENGYFFGGTIGFDTYINTLYKFNLSTLQCEELTPKDCSHAPKAKVASGMVYFNEMLVVHGGYTGRDRTEELHVFDLRTGECVLIKYPPKVSNHPISALHWAAIRSNCTQLHSETKEL